MQNFKIAYPCSIEIQDAYNYRSCRTSTSQCVYVEHPGLIKIALSVCKNVEEVSCHRTEQPTFLGAYCFALQSNNNFYRKYLKSKIISFTVAYVVP